MLTDYCSNRDRLLPDLTQFYIIIRNVTAQRTLQGSQLSKKVMPQEERGALDRLLCFGLTTRFPLFHIADNPAAAVKRNVSCSHSFSRQQNGC